MEKEWGWSAVMRSRPYALACLVFCLIMVPAGRMQDKLGPRLVAGIGGLLVGAGMILASLMGNSQAGWIIGFGILAGAGIGFGYASATPPAVKWFPAAKTGLIAGLVVSGFGLASVYIAPLGNFLITRYDIETTAMAFGIGFLVIVVGLAQLLKPPPAGYIPQGELPKPANNTKKEDFLPSEMLRTWQFYLLWFMYACGAGAGLMVISVAKNLGKVSGAGVIAVTALAIGNGAGRIIAGVLSDKLGRKATLFIFFVLQALMVILLSIASKGGAMSGAAILSCLAALVGANYGSNLSLFPSATKDFYGLKNFGMNYGLVFTAWGIGGYVLSQFAARVYDGKIFESWKGSFDFAFYCSAGLLILAAIAVFLLKPPHHTIEAGEA
jgi:MFS family permease